MSVVTTFGSRLQHAWNAFLSREPTNYQSYGNYVSAYNNSHVRYSFNNERSIVTAIYNRIAMDCASTTIEHVRTTEDGRYKERIDSGLNTCLTIEANKDQTARAFIQDAVEQLLNDGEIAICPIDTSVNIMDHMSFDISSLRIGRILSYFPDYVTVDVYNDRTGQRENLTFPKRTVAIVENPFYDTMNRPNSVLKRLISKLDLLDVIDEQSGAGKLDLIIQLPYIIKSTARQEQAEARRKQIEEQLANSKYGIAYTDGTEHITQLNRSLDNNLMSQIEYLTSMLYSQLGITTGVLDGSADAETMLNYQNRVVEPIVSALVSEMTRKFLTKTARSQNQTIFYYHDPFRLVPVSQIADIADKFTRNEIMSPNEIRQIIGMKPADTPQADELRNRNINQSDNQEAAYASDEDAEADGADIDVTPPSQPSKQRLMALLDEAM